MNPRPIPSSFGLAVAAAAAFAASSAAAADALRPLVGDPAHGAKLFEKHCKSRYVETGLGLFTSDAMNLLTDEELAARFGAGDCVTPEQKEKFDGSALGFLDRWDVVAFVRSLHMNLSDFFPSASRYVAKTYTIDKYGLDRIAKAASPLAKDKQSAAVFTFFKFPQEEGDLTYVPDDPILLDQLKPVNKVGYLVFLPIQYDGFSGEIGVAMDRDGVIAKMMVHPKAKGAGPLNDSLTKFTGLGRKGQSAPFTVGGGPKMKQLADAIFPLYLRAMETVTMYDREEKERTWAD